MNSPNRKFGSWRGASVLLFCFVGALSAQAQTIPASGLIQEHKIPSGTILPVVLHSSVSFDKCKAGQALHGKIAQEVSLPIGMFIHKGSEIEGHIVEVTPAADGSGANVSLQFDKLKMAGQWVPVVTLLTAIADCPEALRVLSPYAKGTYGIDNLLIAHAGKTAPVGTIVLASQTHNLKLTNGEALLLLVD